MHENAQLALDANLFGLDREEFERLAEEWGEARYRGRQIFSAIYGKREQDIERITGLSRSLRASLRSRFSVSYPEVREKLPSRDGSVRYLMSLDDNESVESVFMPEENRATLCISSQSGCAVDCRFCFTGLMGLQRNITAGEILGQVYAMAQDQQFEKTARVNVVFMGMGEPLLNYGPVIKAVRILADTEGLRIPLHRITVSTSGIIPRIRDFAREPARPKLAISLNASNDEQRTALMPLNRKYPLNDLLSVCREFPLGRRERLTFEYVLLKDVNDSEADAVRVAALLQGIRAKVNLIPYNSGAALPYNAPALDRTLAFQHVLAAHHVPAFIRISRGQDVCAACGQLRIESQGR